MNATFGYFRPWILLCATVFSLICSSQAMATLQARVDRNPVPLNESFNLTLHSDDDLKGEPDLSALKRDFDIVGQSKSSSLQIVNGSTTRSVIWQIGLIAKHSGQLQIPAISIGGQSSTPVDIKVSEAAAAQVAQDGGDVFVEVSAEPQAPHVRQQVILTVRLYFAVALGNGSSLGDPSFPDAEASVERLGDDANLQVTRRGKAYNVIERRYAVFPQKSGQFTSTPVLFDGTVVDQDQAGGFFSFNPFAHTSHHLRVKSNTISLSVAPIPANYANGQWLPTPKLHVEEQWSSDPDNITVGEPITRTLVETGTGVKASQLPELIEDGQIDGFKTYPDQPQLKDARDDSGITGKREQKIAYIATRPGSVTIPAIQVKWWNTKLEKEEVAEIPARSFKVLPGKPDQASTPPTITSQSGNTIVDATPHVTGGTMLSSHQISPEIHWWPLLSLFLALGWLSTSLAWIWRSHRRPRAATQSTSPSSSLAKDLQRGIETSCKNNDPVATRRYLLLWARLRWPHDTVPSLASIAKRSSPAFAAALADLDRALYADTELHWRGDALWREYLSQRHDQTTRPPVDDSDLLPPLYPT